MKAAVVVAAAVAAVTATVMMVSYSIIFLKLLLSRVNFIKFIFQPLQFLELCSAF